MDRSDPQMLEYFLEKRLKNRLKNQKPVPERILALCKDPQVAAVEREDQLFKFDPNTQILSSKKGTWRYETKTWNIFPAEGTTGILRDSSSLLLTIVDDIVGLDVPWDLGPADGPEKQIWVWINKNHVTFYV